MRGKLQRNVAVTLTSQMLSWGLAIVVTFYLPGYLGERNLGSLTLAIAFAGTLAVFVNFGTSTVLVQDIARNPMNARSLVWTALRLRSAMGALLLVVGLLATVLLNYSNDVRLLITLVLVAQVFAQITEVFQSALVGLEAFVQQSSAALAEKLTFSLVTISLVLLKAPLWQFAAVYLLGASVSATVSALAFRRVTRSHPNDPSAPPARTIRSLAQAGVPFLTTRLFSTIYGDGSSALLMSKLSTLEAIGWFGLAKRFSGAAQMIPVAIATAVLPQLTRMHHDGDRTGFARLVWRLIGLAFAAAVPIAVVLLIFPARILSVLHYPPGFAGSIPVLRLAGCVLFLWFVQQAVGTALVAAGKQKVFAYVTGVAALLAFPLCGAFIWLGEHYLKNGAVGAMLGDAALEGFMLICYARALLPDLFPKHSGPTTAEPAASEFSEATS
jgi:O-antigen/teichoic acid export membrane protein